MNTYPKYDSNSSPVDQVKPGQKAVLEIPVTHTLGARQLSIFAHVVRGASDGPVLGILGNVHGDETGILPIFRRLVETLDPKTMRGSIVVVPVANPLAMAAFGRFTPEQHGNPDMHKVFPGNPKGSLTQILAAAVTNAFLKHLDALIDVHSGGSGGRLQRRVDFDGSFGAETREKTLSLCRAFGTAMVHENNLSDTASAWLNKQGKPTVNVEIGGAYLSPVDADQAEAFGLEGMVRVARHMGILEGGSPAPIKQLLFSTAARVEVNPIAGGYLLSNFQSMNDLDGPIKAGTVLGTLFDPYTFEQLQQLTAPVDGRLFFSRYSGTVDAGTKAYAIAKEDASTWL